MGVGSRDSKSASCRRLAVAERHRDLEPESVAVKHTLRSSWPHCGIDRANCVLDMAVREHGGAAALISGVSDRANEAMVQACAADE